MRFLLQPESDSYSLTFGTEARREDLDGGRGRYRADIINASKIIEATFSLNPEQYDYMMAFYRRQALYGAEPFTMFLIVDATELVECTVHFIPGSMKLGQQRGLSYIVGVTLEVLTPFNAAQDDEDDDVIEAFNTANGYTPE